MVAPTVSTRDSSKRTSRTVAAESFHVARRRTWICCAGELWRWQVQRTLAWTGLSSSFATLGTGLRMCSGLIGRKGLRCRSAARLVGRWQHSLGYANIQSGSRKERRRHYRPRNRGEPDRGCGQVAGEADLAVQGIQFPDFVGQDELLLATIGAQAHTVAGVVGAEAMALVDVLDFRFGVSRAILLQNELNLISTPKVRGSLKLPLMPLVALMPRE